MSGSGRAVILAYHRVAESDTDVHGLCIAPEDFRSQMAHLRSEYSVMPLDELVAAVSGGRSVAGAVAVTFDDGYLDNFTTASPVLMELGVPATFFVTTDRLETSYEYWWDTLEQVFMDDGLQRPQELHVDVAGRRLSLTTDTKDACLAAHWQVYRALFECAADAREAALAALTAWSGRTTPERVDHRRMSADELASLSSRPGHAIAAHTVRHLMLPRQSAEIQESEMLDCRRQLVELLGRDIAGFAYPFGACDERTREIARSAFDFALTCEGVALGAGVDPWRLPRLEVSPTRTAGFADWLRDFLVPDSRQ